jgi:GH15 family glucan-1,4-alpha-glucosidase
VLREYALLADGERGALIGPRGDVVWMCLPQWHDDAVFSALLAGPGSYAITPTDSDNVWGGSYEDGTLIWHSRWVTRDALIECREALAYPGDPKRAILLRQLRALDGHTSVDVLLDVRAHFGKERMADLHHQDGVWEGRCGELKFRWSGAARARHGKTGALLDTIELDEGESHDLVLEIGEALSDEPIEASTAWAATEHAWASDVPSMASSIAPRDCRQSYAVLRGLTSSTGAMVAAATMGLPERAETGRNYDYRYAWIRDQCYAGKAVATHHPLPLMDKAVQFVTDRVLADGPKLKPAYRIDGTHLPRERDVDLPGYPGGIVKAGNWVNDQFQLDALGESLLLLATAAEYDHLDREHWDAVQVLVDVMGKKWREPDNGIWELAPKRWAHSRLICAAGLRAIAHHAAPPDASQWLGFADQIVADAASDCVTDTGRWRRAPDDNRVDAALLLPALRGAVPPDDPRSVATYDAVGRELGREGFVYRFSQDPRPLADAEGAFVLCGFLMALSAQQQGDELRAMRWFERNRTACGSPGLFTEEFDVGQRQLRGNFPQAFVHALMLESAQRLNTPGGRLP